MKVVLQICRSKCGIKQGTARQKYKTYKLHIFSDIFDINEPNPKVLQHSFIGYEYLAISQGGFFSARLTFCIRKADKANSPCSSTLDRQFGLFVSHTLSQHYWNDIPIFDNPCCNMS